MLNSPSPQPPRISPHDPLPTYPSLASLSSLRRIFFPNHEVPIQTRPTSIFHFTQATATATPKPRSSKQHAHDLREAITLVNDWQERDPRLGVKFPALVATARLSEAIIHDVSRPPEAEEERHGEGEGEGDGEGENEVEVEGKGLKGGGEDEGRGIRIRTGGTEGAGISEMALRSIYSMAIIRFVGAFVDRDVRKQRLQGISNKSPTIEVDTPSKPTPAPIPNLHSDSDPDLAIPTASLLPRPRGTITNSMYAHAQALGLPESFVELRHQAIHEDIPGLEILRVRAREALEWLWDRWWKNENMEGERGIEGLRLGVGVEGKGEGEGELVKGGFGKRKRMDGYVDGEGSGVNLEDLDEEELRGLVQRVIDQERIKLR